MRRLGRRFMDLIGEVVGELVVWGILVLIGAGVVFGVSALFRLPWLTRAVTRDYAGSNSLEIIGLATLAGVTVAVTWLVRRFKKRPPQPSDSEGPGPGRQVSIVLQIGGMNHKMSPSFDTVGSAGERKASS
ncbi:hypothetical protein Pth03_26310 [Planotetraspora thailandica]|uniref:Uncharacterized protein n=1 Tax=Planotetraspora thailandica TaxID=487172 RepID=A0A8J3UZ49_9ACTN|nr:hypothetical protein Pth03_26310 [Planotetraspora thailandica]